MKFIDRQLNFPVSCDSEMSILSWNVLAPSYDDSGLDWATDRFPSFRRWFDRLATLDVICLQELDVSLGVHQAFCDMLSSHGFIGVVQQRQKATIVNATYVKASRFQVTWTEHRSRVLLCALQTAEGHEVCVANVHLEAGDNLAKDAQRVSQLSSALKYMKSRSAWCNVICGDFNLQLSVGSRLHELMLDAGMAPAPSVGPTISVGGYVDSLDHIWTSSALRPKAIFRSEAQMLRNIISAGLPTVEYPSDHLPVAVLYQMQQNHSRVDPVMPPLDVDATIRKEWLQIVRLTPVVGIKSSKVDRNRVREQREVERAYLDSLAADDAKRLLSWKSSASETAKVLLKAVTFRSVQRASCGTMPCIVT
eukprot:TRINITY_DN77035_c0_g1_i1.p1 TRINITY_DN77035_c0_g1~~TRINITY_DN77035_c0_g1_i1.p1  ORF type:complete len:364 (-),score=38.50 TRINITY_DN77035_c0_g1_i1:377-1468(-)